MVQYIKRLGTWVPVTVLSNMRLQRFSQTCICSEQFVYTFCSSEVQNIRACGMSVILVEYQVAGTEILHRIEWSVHESHLVTKVQIISTMQFHSEVSLGFAVYESEDNTKSINRGP